MGCSAGACLLRPGREGEARFGFVYFEYFVVPPLAPPSGLPASRPGPPDRQTGQRRETKESEA